MNTQRGYWRDVMSDQIWREQYKERQGGMKGGVRKLIPLNVESDKRIIPLTFDDKHIIPLTFDDRNIIPLTFEDERIEPPTIEEEYLPWKS